MTIWSLEQRRQWVLDGDAQAGNPIQLWVGDEQIVQENGSNPKIVALAIDDAMLMGASGISETIAVYRCRIVRGTGIQAKLDPKKKWELQFPGTDERVHVSIKGAIAETEMIGLGWEMILEAR